MRKIVSIILALAMIMAMATTVFAADENTTLTITKGSDDSDRTYIGYQLLKLTSALKDGEHHPTEENHTHTDECYVYSYTVNAKYMTILQEETFAKAGPAVWGTEGTPASAGLVTEEHIKAYLATLTSDSSSEFGTLRQAADRIYREIQKADPTIAPDAENLVTGENAIAQGYWMFVDVTTFDEDMDNTSNSLVILDTKNLESLTIAPKVAIPLVEKKVKDIEDSEDNAIIDNAWNDSGDFDIGDMVPFKLTATLPSNFRAYEQYQMIFHDTLSEGFAFDKDSVKVYMYATKHLADVNTSLDNPLATIDEAHYNVAIDKNNLTITFDDVRSIEGASSNYAIVVYYEAKLEDPVIGADGNPNEVYLEYSNDPYHEGTGKTNEDIVKVFTYELVITKVDSDGHALAGAGFTLWKKQFNASADTIPSGLTESEQAKYNNGFRPVGDELEGSGDGKNIFTWSGLDDGDYILSETTTPDGYNSIADIAFSIDASHELNSNDPQLISINAGTMGLYEKDPTGIITSSIENKTGTVLPSTGAQGTMMLIGCSSLFVMIAVVFMVTRKKMSIYED